MLCILKNCQLLFESGCAVGCLTRRVWGCSLTPQLHHWLFLTSEHGGPCIPQVSMGWHGGQGTKLGVTLSLEGLFQRPDTCRCSAEGDTQPESEVKRGGLRPLPPAGPRVLCFPSYRLLPCARVCRWEAEVQVGSLLRRDVLTVATVSDPLTMLLSLHKQSKEIVAQRGRLFAQGRTAAENQCWDLAPPRSSLSPCSFE